MPQAQSGLDYQVYIRDKSFNIIGLLDDFESLDYTARYNDVGEFVLVTSKFSPHVAQLVRGNGLVVVNTQSQAVVLSGPIRSIEKHSAASPNLTISGWDDMVWIKRRKAWPVQSYCGAVLTNTPIRYYRLGDGGPGALNVTTVAADAGSQHQNGTYVPSNLHNAAGGGLNADTDGGFGGNGIGYVTCPTTGLPTGNSAITLEILASSAAATLAAWVFYGAVGGGSHNYIQLYVDAANVAHLDCGAANITSAALSVSAWHHIVGTWDGTNLVLWADGAQVATATPGAQTIPTSGTVFRIGANGAATPGAILPTFDLIDEVAVYAGFMTVTPITAHYQRSLASNVAAPFNLSAFDTQSGQASTLIWHYVNWNLGNGAQTTRWPGDILKGDRAPLTMAADPAIGGTVAFAARFDSLLTACQIFAVASEGAGTPLGFKLIQSSVGGGTPGALTFTIYAPVFRPTVVFSESMGTLADYTYTLDESTDNFPIIGGSGTGTARTFSAGAWDGDSILQFGLIEGFVNFSGSSDQITLQSVAVDEYTKNSNKTAVDATPADALHMVFGTDYNLGDVISVIVDGDTITDQVREAHLTITTADGALWNPVIGSVNAKQATAMLREMLREMRASHGKILYLEGVQ